MLRVLHKSIEELFIIAVLVTSFLMLFVFIQESFLSSLVVLFYLLFWVGSYFYTKDIILSSFLYILFVLPFNITKQIPFAVEIFNTEFVLSEPFVDGIFVNYFVPTFSILDLGLVLFLASLFIKKGFSCLISIFINWKNGLFLLLIFLFIQSFILGEFLVLLNSLRLFSILYILYVLVDVYKGSFLKRFFIPSSLLFVPVLIFQGVLGIVQFLRGSSVGLSFLGESSVVSGMQGSSFIDLGSDLYLRAYGTFPHPNVFAGFLLLFMFLGVFLFENGFKKRGLFFVLSSFLFMLFTFSRVGIFLGVVVLLFFLFKNLVKSDTLYSFSPVLLIERFVNLFDGGDSGLGDRLELLKSSFSVLRENWFLGVGFGNYVSGLEGFVPRGINGLLLAQPVHNVFVLLLCELGVFGVLLFLYSIIVFFLRYLKRMCWFKWLVVFCFVVIGLWDHYLLSLPQGLFMTVLFTLLLLED